MTDAPPIVFIARHGARLDAADKDWHLTSPTPYDPPLSYGGWMQARALGLRIASLLQDSEFTGKDPEPSSTQLSASDSSPRYNFIVHTSPYLRCLQTAIGVSAGLSHYRPGSETSAVVDSPSVSQSQPGEAGSHDPRPLLRVDAFLGEWLSPDYFDQIVPPPASDRMVASAKAELLRRGEGIPMSREIRSSSGHFPGGWGNPSQLASPDEEGDRRRFSRGSSTSTTPSGQQPQRPRASTYDNLQGPVPTSDPPRALGRLNTDLPSVTDAAYVPPTPGYAVSPSDPIPSGYVAHARDACTRIDYQWDSMRTPYWGTGGDYGEEWSSMHERVHAGFQHMVDYYRQRGSAGDRSRAMSNGSMRQDSPAQTVLIIITHGADCNALIGSLAGRSVLLDISTASLTMAVRRDRVKKSATPDSDRSPVSSSPSSPSSQGGRSVSQGYSLQLIASNDHLRAGVNPSQLASLSSPSAPQPLPPPSIPTYRNRLGSRPSASILQGTFLIDPTPKVGPSSRSWSMNSRPSPTSTPRGTSGLWGSLASPAEETDGDTEDVFVPNFGDPRPGGQRPVSQDSSHSDVLIDRSGWTKQLPQRTLSQRGLWGSAPSLEDRDAASRRRWTVTEQKL
ncbi:uncharacterized protein N7473_001900 [Penicillium subrubescens]|nr:uncharacterized protein N7473_001900 [Penicillium subrubescens]KAJ5904984.1 hypothetical protein N7473_001900 [Penicillium subrubescens]